MARLSNIEQAPLVRGEDIDREVQPFWLNVIEYRVKPREVVAYSCVLNYQEPGKVFFNCKEGARSYYTKLSTAVTGCSQIVVTGYLKRTTVDNKVVSFEYIPLD